MDGYDTLLHGFRVPDGRYGPVPLWWWDAERVTPERIRWQMEKLRQGGLQNLCVINLAPAGPNAGSAASVPAFYHEAWWECWETAVRTAERLQMSLWYYDQIGFSGANFPAQIAMEHPEFRGFHLTRWKQGEAGQSAVWFRDGAWAYGVERSGFDWLNPDAGAALLDRIHGEMERRLGPWLGKVIVGSFQDELPPLPTWSDRLADRYAERYGKDVMPEIPQLFEHDDKPGRSLVRRRVYALLAELAEEAFFRPLGEWHTRHHMILGCDQAGPGREVDPYGAQRLYLDYPRTHRWFQAPGNDPDGEIKPHASIAHQWHDPRVWLEAFHSSGWGGTLEDTLHWLLPWYQAGATLYNPHAIYFSTVGGWWEWAAPDTGWRQPYFEHYPVFADGIARLSKVLSLGRHTADIAVYYPGHPLWESMAWSSGPAAVHPMTLAKEDPDARVAAIRAQYWAVVGRQNRQRPDLGALRRAGRDFDTIDDEALRISQYNQDGLHVGDETHRVLIFAGTEAMDEDNRERVQRWIDQGGIAIGVGVLPDERVLRGVRELDSTTALAAELERVLPPRVAGPGQSLIRAYDADTTLFLLMPPEGSLVPMHDAVDPARLPPTEAEYWLRAQGVPELWDPWSGNSRPLDYTVVGDGIQIRVPLMSWPAALVVVRGRIHASSMEAEAEPNGNPGRPHPYPAEVGERGPHAVTLPDDGWTVSVEPTLDNRYQDFDRHCAQAMAGVEIRRVEVADDPADRGLAEGWHRPGAAGPWYPRLWSESAAWTVDDGDLGGPTHPVVYSTVFGDLSYRTWAGRMARIPRTFLNLGSVQAGARRRATSFVWVPKPGTYWLQAEGSGEKTIRVDTVPIVTRETAYAGAAPCTLEAGWRQVELEVTAVEAGPLRFGIALGPERPPRYPQWVQGAGANRRFTASLALPTTFRQAALHLVVFDGVAELEVNGQRVLHLGDYMPYSHWGQQACDATPWLQPGDNILTLHWTDESDTVRAFVDGTWTDAEGNTHLWELTPWRDEHDEPASPVSEPTDAHWLRPRPHLLADVEWLEPDAVPGERLTWAADPARAGKPVWIRCALPVGARTVRVAVAGTAQAWVDGEAVAVHQGHAITVEPAPAGRMLVLRIIPDGVLTEAAVLKAPMVVETAPADGRLGDWRQVLHLSTFSGVVEYERTIEGGSPRAVIDLGDIRGTAEIWVDGWNAGVRLWHPYQFELTPAWGPGSHRLRVRVTNTLGAFYADGKPTSLCPEPQRRSGWFGPVRLYER